MESGEVGVDVAVDGEVTSGSDDGAFIGGPVEISDDGFDCGRMTFLRAVVESSDLADSEGDVRTGIGREVKEHSDDGGIAPFLCHGFAVRVNSQGLLKCWGPVWIAVRHAGSLDDFLD